jgi:hypothetical protein
MSTQLAPSKYLERHYAADLEVFGSSAMCGFSLGDALKPPKRPRFQALPEFVVCQFELNLLNQAMHAHCPAHSWAWRSHSPAFADTHGCSMGHGMGNQLPYSILRFAQHPFNASEIEPVTISWELLGVYTAHFLGELLEGFAASPTGKGFVPAVLLDAIKTDGDCVACMRNGDGWELRDVTELMKE